METKDKIRFGLLMGIALLSVIMTPMAMKQMRMIAGEEYSECGYSKYNIYSNSTEAYESFFGTKCYIPVNNYYESNEECGLFGISCYESSKSHIKNYKTTICFYKETGERC